MARLQHLRTTANVAPSFSIPAGELSVELSTQTRVWLGDGLTNRLLISSDPDDMPTAGMNYLPIAGGQLSGGIGFGGAIAASPVDLSRHISLHSAGYGFSITGGRLNYVAGAHVFVLNTAEEMLSVDGTGLTMLTGNLSLAADPSLPQHAATKNYTDRKLALTGGVMEGAITLPITNPIGPYDAAHKTYVEETMAANALWQGTYDVATNDPDIGPLAREDYSWTAITDDPNTPVALLIDLPPIPIGTLIHNSDLLIYSTAEGWGQIKGSSLTKQEADAWYVNVTGDTMSGGLNLGSAVVTSPLDITRHISLFGIQYGFSVTSNTQNYVSAGNHVFYSGGVNSVTVGSAGLIYGGLVGPGGNWVGFKWSGSALDYYVDGARQGALVTGGPYLPLTGGTFVNGASVGFAGAAARGWVRSVLQSDDHFICMRTIEDGGTEQIVYTMYMNSSVAPFSFGVPVAMGSTLTLAADPTTAMQAATKQYIDREVAAVTTASTLAGSYHVSDDVVRPVPGISVAGPLPPAGDANLGWYFIITSGGVGTGNAPPISMAAGDWLISNGIDWIDIPLNLGEVYAVNVGINPIPNQPGVATVQASLEYLQANKLEVSQTDARYLSQAGGTLYGELHVNGRLIGYDSIIASAPGGNAFIGSWQTAGATPSNVGIWNSNNTLYFGNADGSGTPTASRANLDGLGNLSAEGVISGAGVYFERGNTFGAYDQPGVQRVFQWSADWYDGWVVENGTRTWNGPGGNLMTLDGIGNLWALGSVSCIGNVNGANLVTAGGVYSTAGLFQIAAGYYMQRAGDGQWHWVEGGGITMTLDAGGSLAVTGNLTAAGAFSVNQGHVHGAGITYPYDLGFLHAQSWDTAPNTGGLIPVINGQGSLGFYQTTGSDVRLKSNIRPAGDALADILQIEIVAFDRTLTIDDTRHVKAFDYGFVADQVETVATDAVLTPANPEWIKSLDLMPLLARSFKAIQQLVARVAVLEGNA